jgi:predicted RecB family nuclease
MQITRRLVEAYLNCKYKAYLLASGRTGTPHDLETVLAELQTAYQEQAAAVLIRKCKAQASACTNSDIHSGQEVILGPTLEDGQTAFQFDALRRMDGKSSLGPFHYSPVLSWQGESPGRNQTLLMAAGGIILSRHQRVQPRTATVIFGADYKARTIQLGQHYKAAQHVLDGLLATVEAPRLILNDHCSICEFRAECREQAIKTDDLSLLGHMTAKKIDHYAQTGTLTVTQLSHTYHARRHRNVHPKQNPRSLPLHALAIRQKRILVIGKPAFPKMGVRIYFDAEGDFDRKFTYLLGLLIVKDGKEEMISLWADDPSQQKRLFEQFVEVLKQHDGYTLFHYGQYEAEILCKMRAVVRPKKAVDAAISASVNVLTPLHSDVYFPTYSNGLKDIGKYLGFSWSDANASGLQSLAWRRRWELTGRDEFKRKLIVYNAEDCRALKRVTETLEAIGEGQQGVESSTAAWEEVTFESSNRRWGNIGFVLPDFDHINKCAYFDYQRDKVCLRRASRQKKLRPAQKWKRRQGWLHPNVRTEVKASTCHHCGSRNLKPLKRIRVKRQVFDLEMRPSGMVRRVIEYRAVRVRCLDCNRLSSPHKVLRLDPYCHGLKSWAMYQHVQHQISLPKLAALCDDFFHLRLDHAYVHLMKAIMVAYYRPTSKLLMQRLLAGNVIYVDETEVSLRYGKGYVWALTNGREVVYLYRPSREVGFLKELLAEFKGVLVSDFYPGYDGMPFLQQKCLIHLIRDMNSDLRKNPFDDELKALLVEFGTLLRGIVETIDRHGLDKSRLTKHKPKLDRFLDRVGSQEFRSQVAQGYKDRFAKYRDKLFVFLEHDGVAWNNNNAEYAIKQFAHYRLLVDGVMVESGLNDYLALLSICVTCKYKRASFLQFLLSREHDIEAFLTRRHIERPRRRMELYPKGFPGRKGQRRLSQQECEDQAEAMGVADVFRNLMLGLKRYFYQVHGDVTGIRFLGKLGKGRSYLTMIRLLTKESSSERGLRYVADLGRLSKYFGIEKMLLCNVLPAQAEAHQRGGAAGYFKDMAEVNAFLETISTKGHREPHRIRRRAGTGQPS